MMNPDASSIIKDIEILKFLPESEQTSFYDSTIAPQIEKFASSLYTNPSTEIIVQWLEIQSAALSFAVEGISEITYELSEKFPKELHQAISLLSQQQQVRLQMLLNEFEGEENLSQELIKEDERRTAEFLNNTVIPLAAVSPATSGILGKFVGTNTFTSSRGFPVKKGIFTLFKPNGDAIDSYDVNTGGGAQTFRTRNGPVPPGVYRVSHHQSNRTTAGMVLNGVGFSFDLNPANGTPVFGRSLFRIHPDGSSPGTNGCLGVHENTAKLKRCERQIADLLNTFGVFKISVTY